MEAWEKSRAWIELDMEHLRGNVRYFKRILPKNCILMPAVKANAYGHGAILVARVLQEEKITHFCVASVSEGIQLREAGIKGEILILGYTAPECFEKLQEYALTQTIVDVRYGKLLADSGCRLLVQLGVDTGMHRLGEMWTNTDEMAGLFAYRNLKITGVFSHLCTSDGINKKEVEFTREQIRRFHVVVEELYAKGCRGFETHLQGSYGILNYPDCICDCARPGIALYGVLSTDKDMTKTPFMTKPVLSLKTRVECVRTLSAGESAGYGLAYTAGRESRIAVLSIGYADGIPRELSGKGYVLIRGERAPIVGRICMDQMFVDITALQCSKQVQMHEEAVLIGESEGAVLSAEQFAAFTGTITNESLSRLGSRLNRMTC